MVIREVDDGSTYVSTQEEHAELSAQFAAHWGNDRFAQLRPYDTMVFATTYHDSGYREWEGLPRMNVEKGRPFGHRERIPGFEATELHGLPAKRGVDPRARPLRRGRSFPCIAPACGAAATMS